MKADIQEVKDIIELKTKFSESSLPELISKQEDGDGILEQVAYYKPNEFGVYIDSIDKLNEIKISIGDVRNWMYIAKGTLIFSIFESNCCEGNQLVTLIELFDNAIKALGSIGISLFNDYCEKIKAIINNLIPKN